MPVARGLPGLAPLELGGRLTLPLGTAEARAASEAIGSAEDVEALEEASGADPMMEVEHLARDGQRGAGPWLTGLADAGKRMMGAAAIRALRRGAASGPPCWKATTCVAPCAEGLVSVARTGRRTPAAPPRRLS